MAKKIISIFVFVALAFGARAQYYEMSNQLSRMLQPALSGSASYRGFVDLTGLVGFGDNRVNFAGISTTQGFQYNNWFFMGVGMGIDIARGTGDFLCGVWNEPGYTDTQAVLPVFSDFRFNAKIGKSSSLFIDLKLGAAWFLGSDYMALHDAVIGHGTQFLLRPTVGFSIPLNKNNPKQAFNVGLTYQLLTSESSYRNYGSPTLNNFGATLSFQW